MLGSACNAWGHHLRREKMRMGSTQIAAIVFFFCAASANAEFVNGVETFPGTTRDTATWGVDSGDFTQNNGLFYNGNGGSFNTINQTVAWGQSVTMMATGTASESGISLFLTNNSVGSSGHGSENSAFWSFDIEIDPNPSFNRIIIGTGTNGAWGNQFFTTATQANHKYGLEIQPLSSTSALFTLLDSDGSSVLESHLYNISQPPPFGPSSVPNNMHISINGDTGPATIDSVAITPEPAIAAPIFSALLALLGRAGREE